MLGHNVTSPLLFGVASSNGFSANADELKNSSILFDNMVIRPMQEEILESIDKILAFNGISLKLFFRTLQPLEFVDLENTQTEEQVAEETGTDGTELSSQTNALIDLGEDADPSWVLIDEKPVDYDNDDLENENLAKEEKQSLLSKIVNLVSTGDARPNITDKQDKTINGVKFVVRYKYEGQVTKNPRDFCSAMVKANKLYRKQDILNMGSQAVNPGWGANGSDTYSIWLYKGGGNCHHRWNKQVYAVLEGSALDLPKQRQIAQAKAAKFGYKITNPQLVSTRPVDMPYNGFLPTNKTYGK
jgi:hypothetical protein